jgi:hypothetical protein
MYKLLTLLFLGSVVLASGCAARRSHDYIFSVTGVVTAEDGSPLGDAEITFEVNGKVYEAITPVKTVNRLTDNTGGFVFTYISHERAVRYTVTATKEGFEPQTVSGSAPPAGHHTIRLKKLGVQKRIKDWFFWRIARVSYSSAWKPAAPSSSAESEFLHSRTITMRATASLPFVFSCSSSKSTKFRWISIRRQLSAVFPSSTIRRS